MTSDIGAALEFYGNVLGLTSEPWGEGPNPYTMIKAGETGSGGVMLLPEEAKSMGAPNHWLAYTVVPDVDATVAQVTELGGRVYKEGWDIPEVGRLAILADPQGATFAIYTPASEVPGQGQSRNQLGSVGWHELMTSDWEAGFEFYAAVFGWAKTSDMEMGPAGTYRMYGLPGEEFSMSVPYTLFPQACGGCHGSLTGRPSDTFGTVDAVTSASRTAATWDDPGHHKTEPVNYGEDLELTSVIFDEDIGPIIEARCTDCHGEDSSLDLQGEDAFEQLREHVAHSEALASRSWLIEVLTAEELDAPRDLPAHPTVLAEDELLALIRWIDLGATR